MRRLSEILLRHWGLLLAFGLASVYGRLAWVDPILERDDRHILRYLKTWSEIRGLISTRHFGELVAYQPLKDLSLALDGALTRAIGHGTYHWTNLLIWLLCCLFALKLLEHDRTPKLVARVGVLAFAFHPIFVGSVAWISARKHLLAFLFILIASWELLRIRSTERKINWRSLVWYVLALLCHPIQVLWPLWVLARARWVEADARKPNFYRTAGVALLPLFLAGIANAVYYSGLYVQHTTTAKLVPFAQSGAAVPLLAFGRYFANIVAPMRLSPIYQPSSLLGIVGLLAIPVMVLLANKLKNRKLVLTWLFFGALPLLVVTVRMTQVFVSDTYALAAGFGCIAAATLAWENLSKRIPGALVAAMLLAMFLTSANLTRSWMNDDTLWSRASEIEPTGRALALHARYQIDSGRVEDAADTTLRLQNLAPDEPGLAYLTARLIAEDPRLAREQRVKILQVGAGLPGSSANEVEAWSAYFLAQLYARGGEYSAALASLRRSLSGAQAFAQDLPAVVAELDYFCRHSGSADCAKQVALRRGQIRASGLYWDDRPFNDRLKELGS